MLDVYEAINDIIEDINTEHYNDICDELELRVESGDLTLEDAQVIADKAADIFIEKKGNDKDDDEDKKKEKKAKLKKIAKGVGIGVGAAAAGAGAAALGYKHVKRKKTAATAAEDKRRVKKANLKKYAQTLIRQDRQGGDGVSGRERIGYLDDLWKDASNK